MQTRDLREDNVEAIARLFPSCITEATSEDGSIHRLIDFEALKRQLSGDIIPEGKERYVFTWPGKSEAQRRANISSTLTLRPCRDKSVDFDNTKNIYIEGDNLEALKLLRETYLGEVKVIYIDPPYNTGNDFVYNDNYSSTLSEYADMSGDYDECHNKLLINSNTSGRFHTNWLDMIYPRLVLAKDFLSEDGVIAVSIDDCEIANLIKIMNEIFGESNFIANIIRNTNSSKNQSLFVSISHEYCLLYAKNIECLKQKHAEHKWSVPKNNTNEYIKKVNQMIKEGLSPDEITEELKILTKYPRFIDFTNYWYFDDRGLYRKDNLGGVKNGNMNPILNPLTNKYDPIPPGGFRYNSDKLNQLIKDDRIHFHTDGSLPTLKRYLSENEEQRPKSIMSDDQRPDYALLKEYNTPFDNPKQLAFMERILQIFDKDSIIMDFFSGSGTTAEAVLRLNKQDGGSRKYILVQIGEECDKDSEAYSLGYRSICDIGIQRIKRAGQKIKDYQSKLDRIDIDCGIRVLKVDSSNMNDVFYNPQSTKKDILDYTTDNIKLDRSSEDLLFQVILELGIELSAPISKEIIDGKEVLFVDENYLIACFDENIDENVVAAIAKRLPRYVVFRDSSLLSDAVAINYSEIFKTYSPDTKTKVL